LGEAGAGKNGASADSTRRERDKCKFRKKWKGGKRVVVSWEETKTQVERLEESLGKFPKPKTPEERTAEGKKKTRVL